MENMPLPKRFVNRLCELRGLFTAPTFLYSQAIVAGILLVHPKKAITKAVRLASLEKHFSNVHRAVSQYRWDATKMGLSLLLLLLHVLRLAGPLTFGLHSSLVPKHGGNIFHLVWVGG